MSKKLSIIRFKPKPEHYDDFLQDVIENGKEREPGTHFVMKKDDEVIAIVIRDSEGFEQNNNIFEQPIVSGINDDNNNDND